MIFPQGDTFGATFRGVDPVTPVGTAAAFAMVVDFNPTVESRYAAPSIAVPVLHVASATNGSTFKPMLAGIWVAFARFNTSNGGAIALGIGRDFTAAQLIADPFDVDSKLFDTMSKGGGAPLSVLANSGPRGITRDEVENPALGIWRVLASNAGGTNTPVTAASLFAASSCAVTFLRLGPLPAEMMR